MDKKNKIVFITVISILFVALLISSVSAKHSWWHFWGEEVQFAPSTGTLSISSDPEKASVYINGVLYLGGTTGASSSDPLSIPLNEGSYQIKLTKTGYDDYVFYINIESGKTISRHAVLTKLSCVDTDGGKNYDVKGNTNVTNSTGKFSYIDTCFENIISEYYCDANKVKRESYNCPYDCANGACKVAGNETNQTLCGNGIIEPDNDETCDDGNVVSGDGCSSICRIENCRLASANWSLSQAKVGQIVNLTVKGSDCEGMEVLFRPLEDDIFSGDDIARVNPSNAIFRGGSASTSWAVEDQFDEGFTKPEYYFIAGLKDDSTKNIKSGLLQVV